MTREARWLQTWSGKKFVPLAPTPEMICIEDIAHGLSNLCRFSGQTSRFYSVGQHSIVASQVALAVTPSSEPRRREIALAALMHDASESYIVDVPTPIKSYIQGYHAIEILVMRAIAKKFELDYELFAHPTVKFADMTMLATEKRDLMGPEPAPWIDLPAPFPETLKDMSPAAVKFAFLQVFENLGGKA